MPWLVPIAIGVTGLLGLALTERTKPENRIFVYPFFFAAVMVEGIVGLVLMHPSASP